MNEPEELDMNEPEELEEQYYDPDPHFAGHCSCEHYKGQHSWGSCGVEGCDCEAGWEE